jgi:hypothetical protein
MDRMIVAPEMRPIFAVGELQINGEIGWSVVFWASGVVSLIFLHCFRQREKREAKAFESRDQTHGPCAIASCYSLGVLFPRIPRLSGV